jgi:Tfp pilus assembly protein PilN
VRPVNLIPPEERRGDKAPMRSGPLAYVIVAFLAVALLAVTAVVLTGNQISDRKAEKASLQSQVAQAQAEADRLKSFADFASVQETRELTVASLAQSRFDWERVLRELAIVIPEDVWLTNLSAKVSSDVQTSSSTGSSSSSSSGDTSLTGPSLDIQGCASGHDAVATFLAALRDIDGVTRVSVLSSDRPDPESSTGGAGSATTGSAGASEGCSNRNFVSQFEVVAAFDAVPADPATSSSTTATPTQAPTTPSSTSQSISSDDTSSASAADRSQVQDGQQQLQQQKNSAAQQTQKGRDAVSTFTPGTGVAP